MLDVTAYGFEVVGRSPSLEIEEPGIVWLKAVEVLMDKAMHAKMPGVKKVLNKCESDQDDEFFSRTLVYEGPHDLQVTFEFDHQIYKGESDFYVGTGARLRIGLRHISEPSFYLNKNSDTSLKTPEKVVTRIMKSLEDVAREDFKRVKDFGENEIIPAYEALFGLHNA